MTLSLVSLHQNHSTYIVVIPPYPPYRFQFSTRYSLGRDVYCLVEISPRFKKGRSNQYHAGRNGTDDIPIFWVLLNSRVCSENSQSPDGLFPSVNISSSSWIQFWPSIVRFINRPKSQILSNGINWEARSNDRPHPQFLSISSAYRRLVTMTSLLRWARTAIKRGPSKLGFGTTSAVWLARELE